jgi:hypothetical protein|tara:strand:+ start:865 stop:981 length:117 start_codon:yes stop_codon:yes gene_type:complete
LPTPEDKGEEDKTEIISITTRMMTLIDVFERYGNLKHT